MEEHDKKFVTLFEPMTLTGADYKTIDHSKTIPRKRKGS